MIKNYKVFAVIVTYNAAKWVDKCLRSLKDSSSPLEIIIVDNGSSDGTRLLIDQYSGIEFIQSELKLGFGKAANEGI